MVESETAVRVKESTHERLSVLKGKLIQQKGRNLSFDDVISFLLDEIEKEDLKKTVVEEGLTVD